MASRVWSDGLRFWWWVDQCPLHTECSEKSWKGAKIHSDISADRYRTTSWLNALTLDSMMLNR